MNPIPNSPIKERFRQQYEAEAKSKEEQIERKLNIDLANVQNELTSRLNSVTYKNRPTMTPGVIMVIVLAIIGGSIASGVGLVIGIVLAVVLYYLWCKSIKDYNDNMDANKQKMSIEADQKCQQLRNSATSQIRSAYAEADRRTQHDIDQYDSEVKKNCQKILQKPDAFKPMVDHTVDMFQRMVSHADSASNRKFVETDFTFKVELYGICYKYQSTYSNPKDDFNFDRERFRNLSSLEECEGFAQAIAKMTMSKMKSLYPPNSLNIIVGHVDAEVSMHFKSANKNYVPPRDIY